MDAAEAKKGFLAIGIIIFICIAITAVLAFLGWSWLRKSGMLDLYNASYSRTPIEIERGELEYFIKSLDYTCDGETTSSYDDYETVLCSRQIQGESFNLAVTYSKNQPVSLNLSIKKRENVEQKEIITVVFSELVRIPYKGSNPDKAAVWINQCVEFEDIDSLTSSISISDISFTYYMYAGQYQLTITSAYVFEKTPEGALNIEKSSLSNPRYAILLDPRR
jgi:hypothetical protein